MILCDDILVIYCLPPLTSSNPVREETGFFYLLMNPWCLEFCLTNWRCLRFYSINELNIAGVSMHFLSIGTKFLQVKKLFFLYIVNEIILLILLFLIWHFIKLDMSVFVILNVYSVCLLFLFPVVSIIFFKSICFILWNISQDSSISSKDDSLFNNSINIFKIWYRNM